MTDAEDRDAFLFELSALNEPKPEPTKSLSNRVTWSSGSRLPFCSLSHAASWQLCQVPVDDIGTLNETPTRPRASCEFCCFCGRRCWQPENCLLHGRDCRAVDATGTVQVRTAYFLLLRRCWRQRQTTLPERAWDYLMAAADLQAASGTLSSTALETSVWDSRAEWMPTAS